VATLSKRARPKDLLPTISEDPPPEAPDTPSNRARNIDRLPERESGRDFTGDAGRISELALEERDPGLCKVMGAVESKLRGRLAGRDNPPAPGGDASPLPALLKLELLLVDKLLCCKDPTALNFNNAYG
jgi:hypothetical protein